MNKKIPTETVSIENQIGGNNWGLGISQFNSPYENIVKVEDYQAVHLNSISQGLEAKSYLGDEPLRFTSEGFLQTGLRTQLLNQEVSSIVSPSVCRGADGLLKINPNGLLGDGIKTQGDYLADKWKEEFVEPNYFEVNPPVKIGQYPITPVESYPVEVVTQEVLSKEVGSVMTKMVKFEAKFEDFQEKACVMFSEIVYKLPKIESSIKEVKSKLFRNATVYCKWCNKIATKIKNATEHTETDTTCPHCGKRKYYKSSEIVFR